jgi:hypothetical protein
MRITRAMGKMERTISSKVMVKSNPPRQDSAWTLQESSMLVQKPDVVDMLTSSEAYSGRVSGTDGGKGMQILTCTWGMYEDIRNESSING